ncbi:MAG: hypothetical protein KDN22_24535 [Verrucomicrobiae bacterium]|nr:hypothetical protein [Verrucomicrobiae bacterium]
MKANGWLFVATVIYLVILFALQANPEWDPKFRVGLTLVPLVPGAACLRSLWRSFKRLDELQRRIQLEAWAFALAGTVLVSTTMNILNANGIGFENYPHGPEFGGTYITIFFCWTLGTASATARYR